MWSDPNPCGTYEVVRRIHVKWSAGFTVEWTLLLCWIYMNCWMNYRITSTFVHESFTSFWLLNIFQCFCIENTKQSSYINNVFMIGSKVKWKMCRIDRKMKEKKLGERIRKIWNFFTVYFLYLDDEKNLGAIFIHRRHSWVIIHTIHNHFLVQYTGESI